MGCNKKFRLISEMGIVGLLFVLNGVVVIGLYRIVFLIEMINNKLW